MTVPLTSHGNAGSETYRSLIAQRRTLLQREVDAFLVPAARFVWELGSGHGHFLAAYAAAHPEKLCAGVDIVGERVERALRKRDRAKLNNLTFFHADARLFLETLPAAAQFSDVFVLFPDPWPKLRHRKHRIMQPGFLRLIAERASPDCRLCFRTDHEEYFAATRELVSSDSHWRLADEPWPFEFKTVFQSRAPAYQSLIARLRS